MRTTVNTETSEIPTQAAGMPAYKFLGGWSNRIPLSRLVGINPVEVMVEEALMKQGEGFQALKGKVGISRLSVEVFLTRSFTTRSTHRICRKVPRQPFNPGLGHRFS